MFSTRGSENGQLYTSTNFSGSIQDTPIGAPGQYVGSAHRYRIQREAGQVEYFIDGALVHTELGSFATNLNVAASDFNSGGPAISIDWLHMSPYPGLGHVHLARLRRRSGGQLGRDHLGSKRADRHQHRDQRAHRAHPVPGRQLELVHTYRRQRSGHSRQLALRAVPGAACEQRHRQYAHPE